MPIPVDLPPGQSQLREGICYQPAGPLWQRVPTRTEAGELVADFIMLISGLKQLGLLQKQRLYDTLYQVVNLYEADILLAELNTRMSTLWISHVPRPGLGVEIAAMIHHRIPQAKLISQRFV
ncbi:MAG: hypothetical protein PVF28_00830 [Thioalkalispiraceae bacterium]|jgi:hypothetical protein